MTQEEKQLLLKDLCARLPYGVKAIAKTHKGAKIGKVITITTKFIDYSKGNAILGELYANDECFWLDYGLFKPYLRPMSSMTEEEILEFIQIGDSVLRIGERKSTCILSLEQMDWFNKNMFDYRGLIPKGIALEAPEDMYKVQN